MDAKQLQQLKTLKHLPAIWYNQTKWQEKFVAGAMVVILFFAASEVAKLFWNTLFPATYHTTATVTQPIKRVSSYMPQNQANVLSENTWFGISPDLAINQMAAEEVTTETALNLALKGTIIGNNPQAFIVDNETGKTHLVKLDEEVISGVTLSSIDRRQVVLTNNGKRETLSLPSFNLAGGFTKKKEPTYTVLFEREAAKRQTVKIAATDVEYALGNLGALATEAKFIPRVAGGTVEGYKIMRMKNNSFLRKLSIQERDILLKLDNVLLSDKAKVFPMLMNLKSASNARLLIHRGGENIALDIQVVN